MGKEAATGERSKPSAFPAVDQVKKGHE